MPWAPLTILAVFIFAITGIIDKFLLTKWIKNPIVLVLILSGVGLLLSLGIYLFRGFSFLSGVNIILALIAGVIYMFGMFLYYKAAKIEEISKVMPLVYLSPLFILILAAVFLGEIFTPMKYFGIFLLVAGQSLFPQKILPGLILTEHFGLRSFLL